MPDPIDAGGREPGPYAGKGRSLAYAVISGHGCGAKVHNGTMRSSDDAPPCS